MNLKNYFKELKRRNVFKAALAYLVVAWIIVQVASIVFPAFNASPEILRSIILVLIIIFPVWLIFSWVYEVTPEGLKKTEYISKGASITAETSNKFNKIITGALIVAIILLAVNIYLTYTRKDAETIKNAKSDLVENNENTVPISEQKKSVAVLAFDDMSPKKDQEYFSDGISEEILNQLAKNPELQVISRTSSFYFKGKEATTREIGKQLNVNYLLEGSVRKAGDIIRITAQLINVPTSSHIWSHTYDRKLEDIFKIQDEIAETVSERMKVSILGKNEYTPKTEAYNLYLKAKYFSNQFNSESIHKAIDLLNKALEIDSNYAPIWAELSFNYYLEGVIFGIKNKDSAIKKASEAVNKSIALKPDYGLAYLQLSRINNVNFKFQEAKKNILKALKLDPKNTEIISRKGFIVFSSPIETISDLKKSIELSPLNYIYIFNLAITYYMNREYNKAIEQIEKYEGYKPGSDLLHGIKAMCFLQLNNLSMAKAEIKEETSPLYKKYAEVEFLYATGKVKMAERTLQEFINEYPNEPSYIADMYAFLNNEDEAFQWLNKALQMKDPSLPEAVYYPNFRKFNDDLRWHKLLENMGVPEENGIPGYQKN